MASTYELFKQIREHNEVNVDEEHLIAFGVAYEMEDKEYCHFYKPSEYYAMMHKACELVAFDDCYDLHNIRIIGVTSYDRIVRFRYAGWRPGMEIAWLDEDGNEVWSGRFPEWDH